MITGRIAHINARIIAVERRTKRFSFHYTPSVDLECADEERWQAAFARSRDMLKQMAAEALADFDAGRTEPLDPDSL